MSENTERGARLLKLRKQRGLNQVVVADAVGISRTTLSGIESGKSASGRQTLEALASFYDVSLDFLTGSGSAIDQTPVDTVKFANERALLRVWGELDDESRALIVALMDKMTRDQAA